MHFIHIMSVWTWATSYGSTSTMERPHGDYGLVGVAAVTLESTGTVSSD